MRPIKFRAWDTRNLKMIAINSVRDWPMFGDSYDVEVEDGSVKLMQFTGLLDKNGTEIFEGDVLKMTDTPSKGEEEIGFVWYMAPNWKIRRIKEGDSYDMADFGYGETVDDFEVIGNRYQHPELLEAK